MSAPQMGSAQTKRARRAAAAAAAAADQTTTPEQKRFGSSSSSSAASGNSHSGIIVLAGEKDIHRAVDWSIPPKMCAGMAECPPYAAKPPARSSAGAAAGLVAFREYMAPRMATDDDLKHIIHSSYTILQQHHISPDDISDRLLHTLAKPFVASLQPTLLKLSLPQPLIELVAQYHVALDEAGEAVALSGQWQLGFHLLALSMLEDNSGKGMYYCGLTYLWGMNTCTVDKRLAVALFGRGLHYDEAWSMYSACIGNGDGVLYNEEKSMETERVRSDCYSVVRQAMQLFESKRQDAEHRAESIRLYNQGFDQIRQKAKNGDPRALRMLGRHYLGRFGEICHLAEPDHTSSTRGLTMIGPAFSGDVKIIDRDIAVEHLTRAAHLGATEAQLELGRALGWGESVTDDMKVSSVHWEKLAADQGCPEGLAAYGFMLYRGWQGREPNITEALPYWTAGALKGGADALYYLGFYYQSEAPMSERNPTLIKELFQRAADVGHEKAISYVRRRGW